MKKIFGMRKHRDRDRELDKRYRDELEEYEDDFYEEDDEYSDDGDYPDDEDFEDDDFSDEDYRDDEDYADDDYRDEEDYPEDEDIADDEEYPEDEDYAEGDERYSDERYPEDEDFAEDSKDYRDDEDEVIEEDDYPEDGEYYEEDEFYEEDEYPEEVDSERDAGDDRDYEDDDRDYAEDDRDYAEDEEYPEDEDYPEEDYESENSEDVEEYPEDEENYEDENYDSEYPEEDEDYEEDYDYDREYFDDRYEDEYGNEYPYEDYDRDNRRGAMRKSRRDRRRDDDEESVGAKILAFIGRTSAVERIAAVFALLILAGGIATASFYATALNGNKQLESFNDIGLNLTETEMVGKSGLIAVADAERARAMAAQFVAEEPEEEEEIEVADDAEDVTIKMTVTSIKSDIKVKFINSATGKLVANLPLEIDVVGPDGNTVTYNDHDQDGIIYKKDITKGEYKVTPRALPSGYENYKLEISSKSVTVKDTVEMKAVDVSNEVKKESQVNVAKEDTQVKTEVESVLKDTVEWVESTKTALGEKGDGSYSFEEISKDKITDPAQGAMIGTRKWMLLAMRSSSNAGDSSTTIGDEETPLDPGTGDSKENNDDSGNGDSKNEEETKTENKKFSVDGKSISVKVGAESVSIEASESSIEYSSNDTSIATVDSSGNVTGVKEGSTTITLKAEGYDDGTVKVSVSAADKKDIKIDSSSITVKVGETASIGASASSKITYDSKDTGVATVDSDGKVTGVKEGSTEITLKADGYNDGKVYITVSKADLKKMTVEPASISLKAGEETQIKVTGPESGKVKFESANKDVATVGETDGKVKAVKGGDTEVKITSDGYEDVTIKVSVAKADAKTMTVEPASLSLKVTEEATLKVSGPESGKVKFESGNKEVVTVGETDGKVKAVSVGETTINITSEGYTGISVKVTVKAKEGEPVPMSVTKLKLIEGKSVKISAKDTKLSIWLESDNSNIAAISDKTTITGKAAGDTKVRVKADGYAENVIEVKVVSKDTILKDKDGNEIWVLKSDGDYYKATYEDYYTRDRFYIRTAAKSYKYTGWQTIDGKTYFFDKNGNYVTGEQVIQGAKYSFGADGVLAKAPGAMGIDVSKWNGNIDWNAVKNSGVQFVIIRCGYRGSSAGALIEDSKFKSNIKGAQAAGLKVGVYFFTQAVNEVEAVEEASMVINLVKGYTLSFPVYLDVEGSNGRGDSISASQRTANIKAFCGTIANAGYKAGVYANKTWFTSMINTSQITNYKIWLAQYAQAVTYTGSRYDMWQYTSKGRVTGISGNVDMNICY